MTCANTTHPEFFLDFYGTLSTVHSLLSERYARSSWEAISRALSGVTATVEPLTVMET